MSFSTAELNQIADSIFLMKKRTDTILPKPANTGPPAFTAALDAVVATDAEVKNAGISLVDFTSDLLNPKVWLHNGDDVWRIGSVSKLAIHLAAVQLRDDVRNILNNHSDIISAKVSGSVTTGAVFDALFQSPDLWKLSKGADKSTLRQIAGAANAPQMSNIFDFTKTPVNFAGSDPDNPDINGIVGVLPKSGSLEWKDAPSFDFSELLWLAGARSDDVAAAACASRIGLFYIKAVLQAYGLFDASRNMYMVFGNNIVPHDFLHDPIPIDATEPSGPTYRPMRKTTVVTVKDYMKDSDKGPYTDNQSWVAGSASALTAYMIALEQDKLVSADACKTIRTNLATGTFPPFTHSFITEGVETFFPIADVKVRVTKIGVLRTQEGEKTNLVAEFAVLLATERTTPPTSRLFGMIATGLMDSSTDTADKISGLLGGHLHRALASVSP
jgi:hypothetical protein